MEQILWAYGVAYLLEKHLHMRGADSVEKSSKVSFLETSPHAWSRYALNQVLASLVGNISTCVEQILKCASPTITQEKHLHMRGADSDSGVVSLDVERNISTCVEQICWQACEHR